KRADPIGRGGLLRDGPRRALLREAIARQCGARAGCGPVAAGGVGGTPRALGDLQPAAPLRRLGRSRPVRAARRRGRRPPAPATRVAAPLPHAGVPLAPAFLRRGRPRFDRVAPRRESARDVARLRRARLRGAGLLPREPPLLTNAMALRDVRDGAILVEFPGLSEEDANRAAIGLARRTSTAAGPGFRDAVPAARTLLVLFDSRRLSRD